MFFNRKKYYYDMLLFGVCALSMMLNLFFIFLNVTQRIGAWYEAQTGKDLQYGSRTLYLVSATCQSLIVLLFCNLEHEQFFRDHKFLRSSIHEGILAAKVFGLFVINIGSSQNKHRRPLRGFNGLILRRQSDFLNPRDNI